MMKIKELKRTYMSFTGSKVLKSIMDTTTPGIDIFVRESIQNSMDAVLPAYDYGRVMFNIGQFNSSTLNKYLEGINEKLEDKFQGKQCDYISISDTNTCGLLGEATVSKHSDEPRNLYNLVYDFMNGKEDDNAGGSWGIGKSVYYRYGIGLCFYYTRTYEHEKYTHKLAGALIQNEKNESCLLGSGSTGIAFFGDIINDEASPIYDEGIIQKFLKIFGLDIYKGETTGTIVIIPYLNKKELIGYRLNQDDCPWSNNLVESLKLSLQRWYFPKLNNKKYNGKYLLCAINGVKVELNSFFGVLQKLYNSELNANYVNIYHKNISNGKDLLGTLKYKKFSKQELFIETVPDNLPSPYVLLDIVKTNLDGNQEILFYTRKPGMIITYDVDKFGKFNMGEDDYLLGVFVLNDDLSINNESLGSYMRLTEKANHKEWIDGIFPNYPYFSKQKPFLKICNSVKRKLSEEFNSNNTVNLEGAHSIFQKKLGKKLLPPEDYGQAPQPTPRTVKPEGVKPPGPSKNKQIYSYFNGFKEGFLSYTFEVLLKPNELFSCELNIKTSNKIYSFDEWENFGFTLPCMFKYFGMDEYSIDKNSFPLNVKRRVDNDFLKTLCKSDSRKNPIFKITGIKTQNNNISGFKLSNELNKDIKFRMNLFVKPLDLTYSVLFNSHIKQGGIEDE